MPLSHRETQLQSHPPVRKLAASLALKNSNAGTSKTYELESLRNQVV